MFTRTKSKLDKLIKQGKKTTNPQLLPHLLKGRLNAFAPFVGAGIRVQTMDLDNGLCVVSMPLTRLNKSLDGAQFTGSMLMMTEPFLKLILSHRLGRAYQVSDHSLQIEFLAEAHSTVTARIRIDTNEVMDIIHETKQGAVTRSFEIIISDANQKPIAKITKSLMIRPRS